KTAMTKTYQENQPVERLIVADLAGNKAEATVMIGNIDKTPLIVTSVWHSETGPTRNNVSVTFAVNKEIELPEGWRFRYNAQVYSRLFTASWSGGLLIRDLAGNTATVPIRVSIDRSLPGPIIEPEGHDDELE
ncbi:hypothetical protein FWG76_01025, partial [Candidatus Saccharibacteria bacterium]|nr:hypothetical protein [Candidatus Saccharibacteria bacterium]